MSDSTSRPKPLSDDPLRWLAPLRRQLRDDAFPLADVSRWQRVQAEEAVFALLADARPPLSARLRVLTRTLAEIHALELARHDQDGDPDTWGRDLLGMGVLAQMAQQRPPAAFWPAVLDFARRQERAAAPTAALTTLLALAAAPADALGPRNLAFLQAVLLRESATMPLATVPPEPIEGWYWIDAEGRLGRPRNAATLPAEALFFHCARLGTHLSDLGDAFLRRPDHPLLRSVGLNAGEAAAVLEQVAEHWRDHPRRHARQRKPLSLRLCARLDQLWVALDKGGIPLETSEWWVLNASAGGYGLMHVQGNLAGFSAGQALGVATAKGEWMPGLVRWLRSEHSAQAEMGVEIIATGASAVRLALPGREPRRAFLLPARPERGQGEALLASREDWNEDGGFLLLAENGSQLRITPCRRDTPRHRTGSIEVFEFSRLEG